MHDPGKRLTILTAKEIQTLYGLPQFTNEERDVYFALDPLEKQQLDQLRNITASVYFILQLGYFKAKKQFFVFGLEEASDDVVYILHRYFPVVTKLPAVTISKPTRLAQQAEILGYALKAGQLTYDCRYSTMHGMPVTGGRGFRSLKPLWYNGVPP